MKVLHVINNLEIGGAQRLVSDLLPLQKRDELSVSLLVLQHIDSALAQKVKEAGIEEISLDENNFMNPRIIYKLRRIFADFDIVHVHLFPSSYMSALASIGLQTKMVFTEHSTSNRRRSKWYLRPVEKFIYRQYDRVVSISQQTQDALLQWIQSTDLRFTVINNGVDLEQFISVEVPVRPKSLIMVSRFVPAKDHQTLIRAMGMLDKDVTLRLVGDGETLQECKQLVQSLGLSDRIEFLGIRSDIAQLIASSAIGVQSSHWEGFGLTAVEMMACGKPVIASDVEGLRQVVEGAGLLFQRGIAEDLANCIKSLLDNDSLYADTSQKCRSRALSYSIEKMTDSYIELYNQIH